MCAIAQLPTNPSTTARLGRDRETETDHRKHPTRPEVAALANVDLNKRSSRRKLFWDVLSSPEYQTRFGHLPRVYSVYRETRSIDTPSGRRPCRCDHAARFSGVFTATASYSDLRIIAEDRGDVRMTDVRLIARSCGGRDALVTPRHPGYGRSTDAAADRLRL